MEVIQHNFNRPIAPFRKRIYWFCAVMVTLVTIIPWLGVIMKVLDPVRAFYWWGILIYIFYIPPLFVAWWDAPGENRTTLERAYEFILTWVPVTAGSQIFWEIPWLILELTGHMNGAGPQDVGVWLFWGYGAVDTKYLKSNELIFALEAMAIPGGLMMAWLMYRINRAGNDAYERVKCLKWFLVVFAEMLTVVTIYFVSEIYSGFKWLDYSTYGYNYSFYYVFIFMNIWWFLVPIISIPFVLKMIDYLYLVEVPKQRAIPVSK